MVAALVSFAVAATLLIMLPGPDTTVVLNAIVRGGRRSGLWTAIGVCAGLAVWLAAAAIGLSALLSASEIAYDALKLAGAVYLGWLGVCTLIRAFRRRPAVHAEPAVGRLSQPQRTGCRRAAFGRGLVVDVMNPKVGVFFVTFLPQFIPHGEAQAPFTLLLGALYILGTAVWFALLVYLAGVLTRWLSRPSVRRSIERVTGVVLLGFAVGLVADTR